MSVSIKSEHGNELMVCGHLLEQVHDEASAGIRHKELDRIGEI